MNSKRIKAYYEINPEARVRQSERSKGMWDNPEMRNKITNSINKALKSIGVRKKISDGIVKVLKEKPDILKKRSENLKE